MFNVLVDILPKEYEGYLINYQYYNGILISECLKDSEGLFSNTDIGKIEKLYTAFTIFYGNGIPSDFELALNGLNWFMSCGKSENINNEDNTEYFSFEQDSEYIYSAFRVKYNINLAKEKDLHWFEFIYLFNDLSKTSFREIVNLRMMKPSEYKHYSKESIREIMKQKEKFALKKKKDISLSDDQKQKIDAFYNLISNNNSDK